MKTKGNIKKTVVLWPLFLVVMALLLITCESNFLWKVQALNLHLDTSLFFHEQMAVPGGLLSWSGTCSPNISITPGWVR